MLELWLVRPLDPFRLGSPGSCSLARPDAELMPSLLQACRSCPVAVSPTCFAPLAFLVLPQPPLSPQLPWLSRWPSRVSGVDCQGGAWRCVAETGIPGWFLVMMWLGMSLACAGVMDVGIGFGGFGACWEL